MTGLASVFLSIFYIERLFFSKVQTVFWLKLTAILTISGSCSAIVEYLIINNLNPGWLAFIFATVVGGTG